MKKMTRRQFLKVMGVGAAGVTATAALAACSNGETKPNGGSKDPTPVDGKKKMTIAVTSFESLSPFNPSGGAVMMTIAPAFYQPLVTYDAFGGDPKGVLAKNFKKVEGSTWEVELYDNITDSKGNKITVDDVIFSFEEAKTSGVKATKSISEIKKVDDLNLTITFSQPYPSVWQTGMFYIVSKASYEADGNGMVENPVGTGPYAKKEFVSGNKLVVTKREDYWQNNAQNIRNYAANIDEIEFDVISETAQIEMALKSGAIQFGTINYEVSDSLQGAAGIKTATDVSSQANGIAFNMVSGVFAGNLKLRQAVCYAINKEDIIYAVAGGHGTPSKTWGGAEFAGFDARMDAEEYYDYNPEKAKQLLAEAGYPNGLTVNCLSLAWPDFQTEVQVIQANLLAIGIKLEIHEYDDSTYKSYKRATDGQYDMMMCNGVTRGYLARGYREYLDATQYDDGYCMIGIKDDKLQALYENAMINETDAEAAYALHTYVKENCAMFGTYTGFKFRGMSDKIDEYFVVDNGYPLPGAFIYNAAYDVMA